MTLSKNGDNERERAIRPYMTRALACEIIIKRIKTDAIKRDKEFREALIWAWHALLGPENALDKAYRLRKPE